VRQKKKKEKNEEARVVMGVINNAVEALARIKSDSLIQLKGCGA
jgi:hypothetical protein